MKKLFCALFLCLPLLSQAQTPFPSHAEVESTLSKVFSSDKLFYTCITLDVASTIYVLEKRNGVEMNPLYGGTVSKGNYTSLIVVNSLVAYGIYKLAPQMPKTGWYVLNGVRCGVAAHNIKEILE